MSEENSYGRRALHETSNPSISRPSASMPEEKSYGRRSDSSEIQREEARLLHRLGYSYRQISEILGLSTKQVQYSILTTGGPKRRSGRSSKLTEAQVDQLVEFVTSSKAARLLTFEQIDSALGWNVGPYCIRHALRKRGFRRYRAPCNGELRQIKSAGEARGFELGKAGQTGWELIKVDK